MNSVAKKKLKQETQNGFSLVELLVVLVIVASLVALAIPAINAMQKSFGSTGAEGMISTALSTARTLAIKNGHYAGVRFQKAYDDKGPLEANQYMIFIIYEPPRSGVTLTMMFRAIEGYKPIKLPTNINVIDKKVRTSTDDSQEACEDLTDHDIQQTDIGNSILDRTMNDTSAFSIIFSPAGKLVIHDVRTRNEDGEYRPTGLTGAKSSNDKVFNSIDNITLNNTGQFVQDDYANYGLGGEKSRREFVLYDREKFEKMTNKTQRMNYLNGLKPMYINAYTGEIIK